MPSEAGPIYRWSKPSVPMNRVGSSVEVVAMLWTLIVILLVLWALGLITAVGGAVIHLLLVIAVIILVVQLIGGRRVA